MIDMATIENEASGWSFMANEIGAPITHRMNTLYTDIPIYLERKTVMISVMYKAFDILYHISFYYT